ncbi:dihydrodipicolinate synthase family protein [Xenorhabdus nematophila]|uniref:dihydrodipicolinate synthase family protein n=1 Tax=Xenorhabdus nematophila TaxID=628 RepID=UPI0032B71D79
MTNKIIQGVLPVAILPYNSDFSLDEIGFRQQIDHILATGCDGFVIGQISEISRLTAKERFRLAEIIAEQIGDKGISIMSTGGESTAQAIEFSRQAEQVGCDALLVMHPSMFALDDEQMFAYFASVIESVNIPVLIHHAKSLAKRPLSIDVQAKLLHTYGAEKVQFKPESAPTAPKVSLLRDATQGQARIFEGDGGMMLVDTYHRGLAGVIPATEIAEITVALWRALQAGDDKTARAIGYPLSYLMCHMMTSIDCYLQISKYFLKRRGLMSNTLIRPPVDFKLDAETLREVEFIYDNLFEIISE